ncbi:MAG: hypothetical protein RJA70_1210 [Pseudomonadota bacterium]|jgi:molecular chaperone HtpG
MSETQTHRFQAEVSQVLRLVVNSLYSHKEVFLRELISNAADAIDKRRFRGLSEPELLSENTEFHIRISADADAKTLTISDNGIGMTEADLIDNLGTIARSGTREFIDKLQQAQQQKDLQLIGQFGVGFYSAFLVADTVEVVSRAAGTAGAHRWASDAKDSFTVEPATREEPGTDIVLHLGEAHQEFANPYRLRELISRYSDYIGQAIEMPKPSASEDDDADDVVTAEGDDGDGAKDTTKEPSPHEVQWERVNQAGALWQRSPSEVEASQYEEFYKHLSHDWQAPLGHRHFKVEGTQMFTGLVFLPARAPFDLFDKDAKHGVRLYVKRVFIMDNCEELLPPYLRFVRGLVDSEDLPLNVSRELLQDNRAVKVIRKQIVNHALSAIEELAKEKADDFKKFWAAFGAVLKEGLHYSDDDKEKKRIGYVLRYESSTTEGLTSLADYVSRMKDGQKAIYYAAGSSRTQLESSPHLERLRKHGFEVLYMTDAVDPFAVAGLPTFEDKPLVSAMDSNLELEDFPEEADKKEERDTQKKEAAPLLERFKEVLSTHISEARPSDRLTDSPVCLVTPDHGLSPHIERMMRAQNPNMPKTKRLLEVNAGHPVIQGLTRALDKPDSKEQVNEWIGLLYDQALIAEGSPVEDPGAFSRRLSHLMQQATR